VISLDRRPSDGKGQGGGGKSGGVLPEVVTTGRQDGLMAAGISPEARRRADPLARGHHDP